MIDFQRFEKFLSSMRAEANFLIKKESDLRSKISDLTTALHHTNEAQDIMNAVSILSQEEFKAVIEELVTEALQSVYGDTYSFEIESKIQRNQPEVYFHVIIDGEKFSIKNDELGGGVVDVVSFALRVALWAINNPRTDNVLILDEPLKNLDSERLISIGNMIKEISQSLGLQFIIVTHETQLAEISDASWVVTKCGKTSDVEKV